MSWKPGYSRRALPLRARQQLRQQSARDARAARRRARARCWRPAAWRRPSRRGLRRLDARRRHRRRRARPRSRRGCRSAGSRPASLADRSSQQNSCHWRRGSSARGADRRGTRGAAAAQHRLAGRAHNVRIEALAVLGKAGAVEFGIVAGMGAEAVIGERRLVRVHERHAIGFGIAAQCAARAGGEALQLRQEFGVDEGRDAREALRIGVEGRMDVEAGAAAAAGHAAIGERGIGVGDVDDVREVAADERLQRLAQLDEVLRQLARQRIAESSTLAITPERRNSARSVAVSTMTSATRPEK